MSNGLWQLTEKRKRWVEANRENGFEDGIKRLLTELYPDNAHFIYELLQNAEDTEASVVRFTLSNEGMEFEHDGKRLFALKDVDSITSIGVSTKRDDPTSIGKFGVGFKAVFAYTDIPEIHSGDYHFRICDLVVPIPVKPCQMGKHETKFIFPFNHQKKSPKQAETEVAKGLCNLGDNTFLFLKHIRKVEYLLPDGSLGSLERFDKNSGQIEICASQPAGEKTISHWLLFDKGVEITDEDGNLKTCRIAIAYCLAEEDRKKKQSKWKIVSLDHGQVSIYFPAEKETSNLHFHIHAPFASTVARDSVRDCEANHHLRDHLKNLAVESLATIRDSEMLDVSFLAALPNPADNLPDFYEPIREAIVEAFREQDLTPTRSGEHKPARALYRGPAKIAEVLGDEGLSRLTNYEAPLWAANAPQENQREDRFIQGLEIEEWGWSELAGIFEEPHPYTYEDSEQAENAAHKEQIETFIQKMSDAELMRFYALLGEAVDTHDESIDIDGLCIIRVTSNGIDQHVAPKEAYFPLDAGTSPPSDVFFVKPEVYSVGRSDSQKKYARFLLEEIGVHLYDEKSAIEKILKQRYSKTNFKPLKEDLKRFIDLLEKEPDKARLFTSYFIFERQDGKWGQPSQIFLDQPFMDTGLSAYYDALGESAKRVVLAASYQDCGIASKKLVKFAEAVGAQTRLEITETRCNSNPQWSYLHSVGGERETSPINRDYVIAGIDKLLAQPTLAISKLIWQTMCTLPAHPDFLTATYRRNQSSGSHRADSQLVHCLKAGEWVPQGDSAFARPAEATREFLPEGFPFDPGWPWLKAIRFGEEAVKKSEVYRQKQSSAQALGFESADHASKWAELDKLGVSPDDVLAKHKKRELPDKESLNPERRAGKIANEARSTPEKTREARERIVDPDYGEARGDARTYLKHQYTNDDGMMFCQLCRAPQPVMLNGVSHFEAVTCVGDINAHYEQNNLALCPNHAAMYKNGGLTPDTIQCAILECEGQKIPLNLAGNKVELYFTQQHLGDLRAVLKAL